MIYTSYDNMAADIRRNLYKIPADIDMIVGVPRSGMIAALMIAEQLNKRCTDLDSFIEYRHWSEGGRGRMLRHGTAGKVLIVDDTVNQGGAMAQAREKVESLRGQYDIHFCCVYAEGPTAKEHVDIWLVDNHHTDDKFYLYEWNILQHYASHTKRMLFDMDGVLCLDPPDDRDTATYEQYLPVAKPMVIPTSEIGGICTYRLERYREQTIRWLASQNVAYKRLIMFPAKTREERNGTMSPERFKAQQYAAANWAWLFIESDDKQARRIHEISNKPVWCYSNGRMYA